MLHLTGNSTPVILTGGNKAKAWFTPRSRCHGNRLAVRRGKVHLAEVPWVDARPLSVSLGVPALRVIVRYLASLGLLYPLLGE